MFCEACNKDNIKVINSRQRDGYRMRRYECMNCGYRFTTYEITQEDFDKLRSIDFLRSKGKRAIIKDMLDRLMEVYE